MALYYNMQRNPGAFVRHHWLHTKTGDGKELITVSGITAIHVKGQTHQRWYRETVNMNIDLTHMVPDWPLEDGSSAKSWIKLTNWVPFVTINAIYDRAHSVDAGFAVDEFSWSWATYCGNRYPVRFLFAFNGAGYIKFSGYAIGCPYSCS